MGDFNDSINISNDHTNESQYVMQNKSMNSVVGESMDFMKKQIEIKKYGKINFPMEERFIESEVKAKEMALAEQEDVTEYYQESSNRQ